MAWPDCAPVVGHVRNQGPCGDCWAFGATQALQDRTCIHGTSPTRNATPANLLSTEDVVACMDQQIGTPGQGCAGGDPQNAMYYLWKVGVVSGGDYGETDGRSCLPYMVPPTATATATAVLPGGEAREVSTTAANRLAATPLLYTTLIHHVKKGCPTTDGVNIILSANRQR